MKFRSFHFLVALGACLIVIPPFDPDANAAPDLAPAPQTFAQEIARTFKQGDGLPTERIQLIDSATAESTRAFVGGQWYEFDKGWSKNESLAPHDEQHFAFADSQGRRVEAAVPWREVRQLLRVGNTNFISAGELFALAEGKLISLGWDHNTRINQVAASADGELYIAASVGLLRMNGKEWARVPALDAAGRDWSAKEVLAVGFDAKGGLWLGTRAGVGVRTSEGWRFYEGKDELPYADFTCIAAGPEGEVWFGTKVGAIRFDGKEWAYRQGPQWLPNDEVTGIEMAANGRVWIGTAAGAGWIETQPMTLAEKADFYEQEIERYVKRTPFGYVAEAHLRKRAVKSSADPQDTDNDGLWTAMYGAGECFAYAATKDVKAKDRAKKAFEALRFLQKVTQGCDHSPPKGFVARSIRPIDWPDPNIGRLQGDREEQKRDRLWKVYEPRWPKSADGQWFWKSDTSSDELDGHFFFYPLYYDFCADTDAERESVREVVRDLADHLLTHGFTLVDHDGLPTRWGIYGPQFLNENPGWWQERGLNSLSILTYLFVTTHITGDPKYAAAARELIEKHGYGQNIMYPKVQHGPGSGNQSDDEMAFMCYYGILRCLPEEPFKQMVRASFYRYWANEAPELNPFFNFAYAAHNLDGSGGNARGNFSLRPWTGWQEDAMATLYGFSLDRLNWPHRNSHRLDLLYVPPVRSQDLEDPDRHRQRGHRVNGKVLAIENRHFNHWNTDPWQLDYGGNGQELAAGTVFLLPYYMGLYHDFIEKPVGK